MAVLEVELTIFISRNSDGHSKIVSGEFRHRRKCVQMKTTGNFRGKRERGVYEIRWINQLL